MTTQSVDAASKRTAPFI